MYRGEDITVWEIRWTHQGKSYIISLTGEMLRVDVTDDDEGILVIRSWKSRKCREGELVHRC